MRRLALFAAFALAACVPPMPVAPGPVTLPSPLAPAQAVQRAAGLLTTAGFTVVASDATAGILTASQERAAEKMAPEIACFYKPDAVGARGTRLTMTVSVSAAPSGTGSAVTLASRVQQAPGPQYADILHKFNSANAHADDACASTGDLEKRLAAALSAP